jgi:hypothetical protein
VQQAKDLDAVEVSAVGRTLLLGIDMMTTGGSMGDVIVSRKRIGTRGSSYESVEWWKGMNRITETDLG